MKFAHPCTGMAVLANLALILPAGAATIPLHLARPDGKPGDPSKPVKVYILAGQSNMVGMGDLAGARPYHPSVFLSADPAIIPGTMPIGGSALGSHGIFQSAGPDAPNGAIAHLFEGAYDPEADYSKLSPVQSGSVALGTVAEPLPSLPGPHTLVVKAWIDVPADGKYKIHAGFESSSHALATLDGIPVYQKQPGGAPVYEIVDLAAGKRYPLTITYLQDGSAALWLEQVGLEGRGDLVTLTQKDGKYTYLIDEKGEWTVRNDVHYQEARIAKDGKGSPLSAKSNGNSIGPELGFGWVMGEFHDEQVLLIKTAMGNRALSFDFRPPSSGRTDPDSQWESLEYRLMIEGVRKTLDNIDKVVPGYQGQGHEIAGFCWWQGHKDAGSSKEEYEKHLIHLIQDLRKEFNAPGMRAVVATVGFEGYRLSDAYQGVWAAQMAVGDPAQHPELAQTVASVDTREFWREMEESPRPQGHHYHRNAETYLLVGEAMGREMVRLSGGMAEPIPKSDREQKVAAAAAKPQPTPEQVAASHAATKPMILDGALVNFVSDPRNKAALEAEAAGTKPQRAPQFLDDTTDELVRFHRSAGIRDYDWQPFGPDLKHATWHYFLFDLPVDQNDPKAPVMAWTKAPSGMENWFMPGFDAAKAGWLSGAAPFGPEKFNEGLAPHLEWASSQRIPPRTICDKDVLLLRQTFEFPPLKEGHRYRIVVDGSAHSNAGEGYSLHANGTLIAETLEGVLAWRRGGGKTRGGHIYADQRDAFKGGGVTLAASSFPMKNPSNSITPHRQTLSVWMEEQKLPPLPATHLP
jgi:hypothetical protein